jgi:hypothetical protein
MHSNAVQVVYGPGTFLNRAVAAVNNGIALLARAAQQAEQSACAAAYQQAIARHLTRAQALEAGRAAIAIETQQQNQRLLAMALQSGITSLPGIDNASFISQIVFDQSRGVNQPKSRFAYIFPTANSALIQVRLRASLSTARQSHVISLIRQAVHMPMFRLKNGGSYTVSGEPVVVGDLTTQISHSIVVLLIAAVLVMGAVLLIAFRSRLRLLPLGIALATAGITFGARPSWGRR